MRGKAEKSNHWRFSRRGFLKSCAGGLAMSALGAERCWAARLEIGRTSKGVPVVLTDTDRFRYPHMASGWGATTDDRGGLRLHKGRPYKHPGLDWVAPYGSVELAGTTGTIDALVFEKGLFGSAIAIQMEKKLPNGDNVYLIKYHLEVYKSLKEGQKIEYHQPIGTKSNKDTFQTHTHEHVLLGRRIRKIAVPHRRHPQFQVTHVSAEGQTSQPPGLVPLPGAYNPNSRIYNPLDFYADTNPATKDAIEVAAMLGPQEATKYADIAKSGIILGSYITPTSA